MMMKQFLKKHKKHSESGQSIVELVVSLFAFFTILFMFVQVALGLGVANFVQYATFMAARAFMSGAATTQDQKNAALNVIDQTLKSGDSERFSSIIQAEDGGEFIGAGPSVQPVQSNLVRLTAWEQGVTYKFKTKIYMLPLIPSASGGGTVSLKSESWLGRHTTEQECMTYMKESGPNLRNIRGQFLFDNGC